MKIKQIDYKDSYGHPQTFKIDFVNIIKIEEHSARGEGDKWYYDVHFQTGDFQRIFTPCIVYFDSRI